MNSQIPSEAMSKNLSLLSRFSWMIYGWWITPTDFEILSPRDRLIASPWISELFGWYFGEGATHGEAQLDFPYHLWRNESYRHALEFFSSRFTRKVYDPVKDRSFPNFSFRSASLGLLLNHQHLRMWGCFLRLKLWLVSIHCNSH